LDDLNPRKALGQLGRAELRGEALHRFVRNDAGALAIAPLAFFQRNVEPHCLALRLEFARNANPDSPLIARQVRRVHNSCFPAETKARSYERTEIAENVRIRRLRRRIVEQ
jgi:hypothetical protein